MEGWMKVLSDPILYDPSRQGQGSNNKRKNEGKHENLDQYG